MFLAAALGNLTRHIPNVGAPSFACWPPSSRLAQRWVVDQIDQDRDFCLNLGAGAVASAGVIAFVYAHSVCVLSASSGVIASSPG